MSSTPETLAALVLRLADRARGRAEAEVQSDVRQLLLSGGLDLQDAGVRSVTLEAPAGRGRRIDVEAGCAIIEVKRDLSVERAARGAVAQLTGYVHQRVAETGLRHVGVATDGHEWRLYHQTEGGELAEVTRHVVDPASPNVEDLLVWLESVLATRTMVAPTPREIVRRLGAGSAAFALERAEARRLYDSCRSDPEVRLKRELYAKLLTTAFGTHFTDDDDLFIEHTILVIMAELIAHRVLGVPIVGPNVIPERLVTGSAFREAGIRGVVEADFFDWPVEAAEGGAWVKALARRISRFDWPAADHDVLKVLYESVIDTEQRHRLGEYYTPDWLAERIVAERVEAPLTTRVADVSCGSGSFLFHAVRRVLDEADANGLDNREAISTALTHVVGMDVHPVAVTLARVTYLLAIGPERLAGDRGDFSVPVYLGDAIQWRGDEGLVVEGQVVVKVSNEDGLFAEELCFPEALLEEVGRFERVVDELSRRAANPSRAPGEVPLIDALLDETDLGAGDRTMVVETFRQLCALQDQGRDRIWGYYVRNLVRPIWLAREENRVDVLVGNPPWLAYRYMPSSMQDAFRTMSEERGLWKGGKLATSQDLSALFFARSTERYLRVGGKIGFVMPEAVLSRLPYEGFRAGRWSARSETLVAFESPWSLGRVKPSIFPVPCCVVFGVRTRDAATPMPEDVVRWKGRRPPPDASWEVALKTISPSGGSVTAVSDGVASRYHARFAQGATIVPRVLLIVEAAPAAGLLGSAEGRRPVRSKRDAREKPPWKTLPALSGAVEPRFLADLLVGRSVLPFRCLEPELAVIPWDGAALLDGRSPNLDRFGGLAAWWRAAEASWRSHRSSERLELTDRIDYQRGLTKQLPIPEHRVVYSASGQNLTAARVSGGTGLVEHKLYWATSDSIAEATFLAAVLNSSTTQARVAPLQSRGQFGRRDFDKYVFQLPIPLFQPDNVDHARLAALGARAEAVAAGIDVSDGAHFTALRRRTREALKADGVLGEIDEAVRALLDG